MVTVTEFARAVLPQGTTAIFMDPHEIANVLGMKGVKMMIDEGRKLPLKVFATMPSCVPAAPGLEDAGAVFGPAKIEEAMPNDRIIGLGLVKGFGLTAGAVASTVAHDSHNLLILGTNDDDIALAGNTLAETGGGMIAVKNGRILAVLPLAIAGLMSNKPVEEVAKMVARLDEAWKELGCKLVSPFMTMALLSLPVIPELRLTNRGLVDSLNFKLLPAVVE